MGKILYRYFAREVVGPFLLGVFIFTFVVFMFQILKLAEWVVNYGVGLGDAARLLGFILPPLLVFTLPMAFLLAVMLAVNRLSGDSELIALKAGGVSLYQMFPPIAMLALVAMSATFAMTVYAEPWGKQSVKKLLFDLARQKATLGLTERMFNTDFDGFVLYFDRIDPETDTLDGIFIADERKPEAPNIVIASKGQLISRPDGSKIILHLEDGSLHRSMEIKTDYESASFAQYDIVLDLDRLLDQKGADAAYHEMGMKQLAAHIAQLKKEKGDSFDTRRAWVEYHRRFAFPFACLIFGLVALPLGIAPPRSGKSRGFSVAIVVLCVYYLLFRVVENLGWKGIAHPVIVMWAPNVIFGAFGVWLLSVKANERPIRSIEFLGIQWEKAKVRIKGKFFGDPTKSLDETKKGQR